MSEVDVFDINTAKRTASYQCAQCVNGLVFSSVEFNSWSCTVCDFKAKFEYSSQIEDIKNTGTGENRLYSMKLHDLMQIKKLSIQVLKVHEGWIYIFYTNSDTISSTFVHYDEPLEIFNDSHLRNISMDVSSTPLKCTECKWKGSELKTIPPTVDSPFAGCPECKCITIGDIDNE